jgi:hypothetical protein
VKMIGHQNCREHSSIAQFCRSVLNVTKVNGVVEQAHRLLLGAPVFSGCELENCGFRGRG